MNISRLLLGACVVCALPALGQPEQKPANDLPYPLISLEEATLLAEAKPIKLHLRDVTVKDALEEIKRQTDISINTVTPMGGEVQLLDKKLSIDIETSSLEEASSAIFEEAGVKAMLSLRDGTRTWQVTSNVPTKEDGPLSGTAPFQVRAKGFCPVVQRYVLWNEKAGIPQ